MSQQPYLKGERVFLYLAGATDVSELLDIKSSPFARKYMSSSLPKTEDDIRKEISQSNTVCLMVKIYENGAAIGYETIGYVTLEIVSYPIRASELHICFKENYAGKGYGREVVELVTKYAFDELNLYSIRALIRSNNERSLRCFESVGYRLVGTLPGWSFYDGGQHDCHIVDCIPTFLQERVTTRQCAEDDIEDVVKLSEETMSYLQKEYRADLFGGVDETEVRSAMESQFSTVFLAHMQERLVGFLLLQDATKEEQEAYSNDLKTFIPEGASIVLNGMVTKHTECHKGVNKRLLREAKKFAIANNKPFLIGTVHPHNDASLKSLKNVGKKIELGPEFVHTTRDGRELHRRRFIIELQ